jgi:macrolide-specific efflux system membrane fusion protein
MLKRLKAVVSGRRAVLALGGILLACAGAIGWRFASSDNPADRYLTAVVTRGAIEQNVTALGTLQPQQYVDVGTQVTGQLKKLHVDVGAQVEKGQLLAEIDPTLLDAKVNATRAGIRAASAQVAERQAQAELAAAQHARQRELFAANATSKDALEQAAATEKTARAQIASLRAQIEQTQSTLKADEANLRYTKLYAPIAGTVVSLTAREGQTLVSSQQAPVILRIANLKTMTVSTQVSEADVPKVALDMPVYFNTLGQPDRRWEGKVRQILPTPEVINNVVLYNVLFDVENSDGALRPQMSAQSYFVLARADDAVTVPMAALQPAGARSARPPQRSPIDAVAAEPAAAATEPSAASRQPSAAGSPRPQGANRPNAGQPSASRGQRKGASREAAGVPRARPYLVRVVGKDGQVEERRVMVGVTNRVQAQVLSGLEPGESVVVGTSDADEKKAAPRGGTPRPAAKARL